MSILTNGVESLMQKPDDIPEDVWEVACEVAGDFVNYRSQETWFVLCSRIARAILAERERCLAVMNLKMPPVLGPNDWTNWVVD